MMAKEQTAPEIRLRPLYADMVSRIRERYYALVGLAQAGNEAGVLAESERLMKQTGALVDLLSMKYGKGNK